MSRVSHHVHSLCSVRRVTPRLHVPEVHRVTDHRWQSAPLCFATAKPEVLSVRTSIHVYTHTHTHTHTHPLSSQVWGHTVPPDWIASGLPWHWIPNGYSKSASRQWKDIRCRLFVSDRIGLSCNCRRFHRALNVWGWRLRDQWLHGQLQQPAAAVRR